VPAEPFADPVLTAPPARLPDRSQAFTAAIFFASGASLVVHILTDATLPVVLAGFLVAGAVLLGQATSDPVARARMVPLLRTGAIAGLASTAVYDAARYGLMWAFHLHIKPFKALPYFGNALIGADPHSTAAWVAGVAFHLTNGICFGTGYTVLAGRRNLLWAIGFGLGLEAFMLALYPHWLQIEAMKEFTEMSVFGHVAYGLSLGLITRALLGRAGIGPAGAGGGDGGPGGRTGEPGTIGGTAAAAGEPAS
jgi:hypothetical protein